jgi:hypothetical protein
MKVKLYYVHVMRLWGESATTPLIALDIVSIFTAKKEKYIMEDIFGKFTKPIVLLEIEGVSTEDHIFKLRS